MHPVDGRELVRLECATGRVLHDAVIAPIDSPPFVNAAMDGYALRSADTRSTMPVALSLAGTAWAGRPFRGTVGSGQCVRILTGAALPHGADAVVMQEEVTRKADHITLQRPIEAGEFVREAGRDLSRGQMALPRGRRLTSIDVGLIATLGIPAVSVHRRLRISLLASGDELQPPGHALKPGQIYDSNRLALASFLGSLGTEITDLGRYPDDPSLLRSALIEASQTSDVLISIGGASVGDADHLVPVLQELGRIDLWKVAIKPGKPFAFGRIGECHVFGLPGNPVSAIVTFLQIVRPALLRKMGTEPRPILRLTARAAQRIVRSPGRLEFQRALYVSGADGTLSVTPLPGQEADRLAPLAAANCLLILPADRAVVEAGDPVTIEPLINYL